MKSILIAILLVSPLCGQTSSVVDEAKTKISKQKHEVMVQHAKDLLERKEALEKEMADIDAKLAKLAEGKDVKDDYTGTTVLSSPNFVGNCCANSGQVVMCSSCSK